jgi:hypothetical protein
MAPTLARFPAVGAAPLELSTQATKPASEGISHELGEREETESGTPNVPSPSLGSENGPESSN